MYRTIGGLLVVLTLLRGLLYAVLVLPWQAPDEPGHFEYAWAIARRGPPPLDPTSPQALGAWLRSLPTVGNDPAVRAAWPEFARDLVDALYAWDFGAYRYVPLPEARPESLDQLPVSLGRPLLWQRFSTAYLWTAAFISPALSRPLLEQLYLARLSVVVLNAGIVVLALATVRLLLPHHPAVGLSTVVLLVFWPQHTFINATVSESAMAEFGSTLAFYGWIRLFCGISPLLSALIIISGTFIAITAKANAIYLIPMNAILIIIYLARILRSRDIFNALTGIFAGILLILVLYSLSGLDTDAMVRTKTLIGRFPDQNWLESAVQRANTIRWSMIFDSYWAVFGWMSVRLPDGWYKLLYILVVFGLIGWIVPRRLSFSPVLVSVVFSSAILSIATLALYVLFFDPSYLQGRYLFPAALPLSLVLTLGWARLTPRRFEQFLLPTICLLFLAIDTAAIWTLVLLL